MLGWARFVGVLLLAVSASAVEMSLNQKESDRQICSGMYSRKSWGGAMDPFILTKFIKPDDVQGDPLVSFVVFEWADKDLIGVPAAGGNVPGAVSMTLSEDTVTSLSGDFRQQRAYICDQQQIDAGTCSNLGSFILAANATEVSRSQIISEAIHLNNPPAVNYPVKRTGYYCVGTYAFNDEQYSGVVEFRNAYGELAAAQIAKLPFYAAITVVYAFVAIAWGALYWLHRSDILAVQNYITAILVFLVIEMFMTWLFYDYQNRHGLNVGAKALLVVVSILSAARNSFSFFLLLIVCMGYGVVKPTLGKTMIYVRWLAGAHFVFGVIYAVASLSVTPENAGPLVLLVVLPLAATLTAFYVWTLNSLNLTTKDLKERKQTIKAGMYQKLWYCILISIVVIFVFFFVNSWIFAGQSDEDFVPNHWKSRWFILDGWLNLVYFFDVGFVAYVWRPTANNRRFAMSDEIAQDDDGFEIASIRSSMDLADSDLEARPGATNDKPPAYDPPQSSAGANRDRSPLPAPVPQKPVVMPRESLDGETIFAVEGDTDDEDGDDEERKGLTSKID